MRDQHQHGDPRRQHAPRQEINLGHMNNAQLAIRLERLAKELLRWRRMWPGIEIAEACRWYEDGLKAIAAADGDIYKLYAIAKGVLADAEYIARRLKP